MTEEIYVCPGCGRDDFDSVGKMRRHYGLTKDENHEGSIAYEKVECEECGTEFEGLKYKNRKFCKEECEGKSMEGEDNVNWNGAVTTEETIQKLSEANSGENCYWYGVETEKQPMYGVTGEDHPLYGQPPEENPMYGVDGEDAPWGGVTGEDHPAYGYDHTEDSLQKMSEVNKGKNNHNWKGDTTTKYSEAFIRNRTKAIQRDNEECRVCGMGREDHYNDYGYDLHVHHIVRRGDFMSDDMVRPPDEAAEMSNLITLCHSCHNKAESDIISIEEV